MRNREIKFRAWDREKNQMFYSGFHIHNDGYPWKWIDDAMTVSAVAPYDIMQYTGLKDKNSKEIYEGDYLTCDKDGFTGVVEYQVQIPGFWLYSYREKLYREFKSIGAYGDENGIQIDAEIIGNIYENPTLLNTPL